MSDALTALRSVDSAGQLDDVLGLPDQLRDALWKAESAKLDLPDCPGGAFICGMGGSGVGGDLAQAALGDRASRPIFTVRAYGLPPWTTPDAAVLLASYSGNTEEVLGCYAAAEALGATRVVATTGGELAELARRDGVPVLPIPAGLQPRAAVAYLLVAAAEVACCVGAAPGLHAELDSSAAHIEARRDLLAEQAEALAGELEGTTTVVYGSDLTAPVAYRWKTQINENAKLPAFWHELPEMNHNEIVGWEGAEDSGDLAAVFLEDGDQHPRTRQRIELTARLIEPRAARVLRVETEGETRTERMLSAVMLGDLVSLHLAAKRGVDPSPVQVIERLKDELGRP
jgi:glucose/mannose-6-phosphate isomerase